MKIAVDFDGTVVDHRYPAIGEDVPDAVDVLKGLVKRGHTVNLNTMRSGKYLMEAVVWFINRGIPLSGINIDPGQKSWTDSPKVFADIYIDDAAFGCPLRAVEGFTRRCVDWREIRRQLIDEAEESSTPD